MSIYFYIFTTRNSIYQNIRHMETISKLHTRVGLIFLAIMLPLISFAETAEEEAKAAERNNMIMETACVIVFVGGVVAFLIWKGKHDKQVREKQMEQMKKIQAAKRKAA